jgi:hypothetical protein
LIAKDKFPLRELMDGEWPPVPGTAAVEWFARSLRVDAARLMPGAADAHGLPGTQPLPPRSPHAQPFDPQQQPHEGPEPSQPQPPPEPPQPQLQPSFGRQGFGWQTPAQVFIDKSRQPIRSVMTRDGFLISSHLHSGQSVAPSAFSPHVDKQSVPHTLQQQQVGPPRSIGGSGGQQPAPQVEQDEQDMMKTPGITILNNRRTAHGVCLLQFNAASRSEPATSRESFRVLRPFIEGAGHEPPAGFEEDAAPARAAHFTLSMVARVADFQAVAVLVSGNCPAAVGDERRNRGRDAPGFLKDAGRRGVGGCGLGLNWFIWSRGFP